MNKPAIKQVEVQIMSQSYMLACPLDGEDSLREAVSKVDSAMCRIRDAGKVKARDRIAVLAALNIAFELIQKDSSGFRNASFVNTESGNLEDNASNSSQEAQLQALLAKLDSALAPDGRLF